MDAMYLLPDKKGRRSVKVDATAVRSRRPRLSRVCSDKATKIKTDSDKTMPAPSARACRLKNHRFVHKTNIGTKEKRHERIAI